jgi:hypothetical protein
MDAGALRRRPEPALEVAAHGLVPEGLAPHAGGDDFHRRLSLAKAGDAQRSRQIGSSVLERVLDVLLGNLDLEADTAFRELLDLRPH